MKLLDALKEISEIVSKKSDKQKRKEDKESISSIMQKIEKKIKQHENKISKLPKRTYKRPGTIFKTVNGVRRKFCKTMVLEFRVSQGIDEETIKREIIFKVNKQLKRLNICPEIAYIQHPPIVGVRGIDFIENMFTVQIKFERVKQ